MININVKKYHLTIVAEEEITNAAIINFEFVNLPYKENCQRGKL